MAIKIALAGNPNCGKTTMFNALTAALKKDSALFKSVIDASSKTS